MGDMDRLCTTVVVVGAIVLIVMGYNEMTRLNVSRGASGTCGMRSTLKKDEARSAKQTSVNANRKPKDRSEDFHAIADEWQNDVVTPTHKEHDQDESALRQDFSWENDDEVNKKFDALKVDPQKVKHSANTRAINQNMDAEEPLGSRRTGMVNPMLQMYHGKCGGKSDDDITFSKSCTWFGGTDAYYKARTKNGFECTECD